MKLRIALNAAPIRFIPHRYFCLSSAKIQTFRTVPIIRFHVEDENLLKLTGGIVQGLSGSPILQDGKLIGAVTHVLVNDPTKGYGIFVEEMTANKIGQKT